MNILTNIQQINIDQWNEFVRNHPKGNVFQTPEMYDCYVATPGYEPHVLAAVQDGQMEGIMLYVIMREKGIKARFSARSIIQGAPLAAGDKEDTIIAMLQAYEQQLPLDIIYTQVRNHYEMLTVNDAFQTCGYRFESHLNFLVTLDTEEQMWNRIGKGRIKQIKKAQKNNLTVDIYRGSEVTPALVQEGYHVIEQVYLHAGLPLTDVQQILAVAECGLLVMFVVRNSEGTMLGCRFGITYRDSIYGWYAGSYQEYYSLFPNDILIWETLRWGAANGCKVFDYGGAGEPNKPYGVRKFKQQIGGTLVNFGRYEKIHKPMMYRIGVLGMAILKLLKKRKKK